MRALSVRQCWEKIMKNIKLIIEYDGTNYHGWQSQKNSVTICDIIKETIDKLTGEKCNLIGSSRTDAGVHAFGQVACFMTNSTKPPAKFAAAINGALPEDIIIKESEEVDVKFHARYSACGKKYKYVIYNAPKNSAILRNRAYHVNQTLNFEEMKKAAMYFRGKHDFSAFKSTGGSTKTSVRTIFNTELSFSEYNSNGNLIEFEIEGDGFLYNMVRIIAGTLVDVGLGKISSNDISDIILSKNRKKAGKTLPAQGLYLVEVYY